MMWKLLIFVPALLFPWQALGQNRILEQYIHEALSQNLALKQEEIALQQSLAALKEARGQFLPSLSIQARYSRAGGGRTFDFPVGDLVNPIYRTLNEMLQQPRFPENLPNERVRFLRKEEHDTRLRAVQPLFQPAILHNYKIRANLKAMAEAQRNLFGRQLVADIKTAYFTYLKTVKVVELYGATQELLQENLRVSNSLFENGKVTRDAIYRAQAELSTLLQQKAEAERDRDIASAYFNFLLNRPLGERIAVADSGLSAVQDQSPLRLLTERALHRRDELRQLQSAAAAAENGAKLNRAAFYPGISLVFDYGFEGEKYRFTGSDDYWMASVVVQWNLFNGFSDKAKIQQSTLQKRKIETQLRNLENLIRFQVREAKRNVEVARETVVAARDRLMSAEKSFELVAKKYRQGMASQIEFLDARATFTGAGVNAIVSDYDLYIRQAELEKVTASFDLSIAKN